MVCLCSLVVVLGVVFNFLQGIDMTRPYRFAALVGCAALFLSFTVAANTYAKASIEQLKALAEKGDIMAMSILGERYDAGEGIKENNQEAVRWYTKAAERGHIKSQYNLALMYDKGEGVAKDKRLALIWYRFAGDQGHSAAQVNVGFMYDQGEGTTEDNAEAVKWFKKAAQQGDPAGQYNLGLMYFKGEGVAKDLTEAMKWYARAAQQGDSDALAALTQLSNANVLVAANSASAASQAEPLKSEKVSEKSTKDTDKASKSVSKRETKDQDAKESEKTDTKTRKAVVFDPPSNVRTKPDGNKVLCTVEAKRTIKVSGTGEWLKTDACGKQGYIHRKQLRFK